MNAMHQTLFTALIAVFGAGTVATAQAQEATPDRWISATSMSREAVRAELDAARADGTIRASSTGYDFSRRVASQKSREQLRGEVLAARESGEYDAVNAEAHAFGRVPRATVYARATSAK